MGWVSLGGLVWVRVKIYGVHIVRVCRVFMHYAMDGAPSGMPTRCSCGKSNDFGHALTCARGGNIIRRHDEIRDLTATFLWDVSHFVETEPPLQPLTGETLHRKTSNQEDNSRLDVKCHGFWYPSQDALFDVRGFQPLSIK